MELEPSLNWQICCKKEEEPMKDTNTYPDVELHEENRQAPENRDELVCPRCGQRFEPKEKKCPHCGMKNDLMLCKACGTTMAKNAKSCPKFSFCLWHPAPRLLVGVTTR